MLEKTIITEKSWNRSANTKEWEKNVFSSNGRKPACKLTAVAAAAIIIKMMWGMAGERKAAAVNTVITTATSLVSTAVSCTKRLDLVSQARVPAPHMAGYNLH